MEINAAFHFHVFYHLVLIRTDFRNGTDVKIRRKMIADAGSKQSIADDEIGIEIKGIAVQRLLFSS